jgi:hypothetical protein
MIIKFCPIETFVVIYFIKGKIYGGKLFEHYKSDYVWQVEITIKIYI